MARSSPPTLIKTFSIMFFLSLYYTFITYDGRKSNEQRAKSSASTPDKKKAFLKKLNVNS